MLSFPYHSMKAKTGTATAKKAAVAVLTILPPAPTEIGGRKFIGLGTFVNWFLLGVVADGVTWVLNHLFTVPEAFLPRFLIMLLTLPVVSLGVSLYQSSELGASPYDSLALILDERFPKIPYFWCRIAVDGTSTLLAFLLGGIVGWGTLACALCPLL